MKLSPGIPFLIRYILVCCAPPLAVYCTKRVLSATSDVDLPAWFWVVTAILSGPLLYSLHVWRKFRGFRLRAAALGAVMPTELNGDEFGNKDVLRGILEAFITGYPSDMFDMGAERCGSLFQYTIFWDLSYGTTDPNVVKTILATDFANYEKGEVFHEITNSLFGTGVFNADGDLWKFHRSMSRPFFSRERISHFELFDRHAETAINKIKERMRSGVALDFQDLISRFTLDSATEFLFGSCVHSLNSSLPYPRGLIPYTEMKELSSSERFAYAFGKVQQIVAERPRLGWVWPLKEIFRTSTDEYMEIVDGFIEPILKDALRKKEQRLKEEHVLDDKESQEDETLLDQLVKQTSDPAILHDETLNILLAGRDTTAAALTFGVYLLCQHPDIFKRLRDEIIEHVGLTRRPTYDDIRNMKYLRAFLNETLRLYPSVPFNIRYSIKEGILPNPDPLGKPVYIPPGTPISYSIFNMHRDPKYWGPTAADFDPSRFLDERVGKYLVPNPFIFLPFNGGPRICLGQQFAYNEMSFFIIRLLQNFSSVSLDLAAQPPDTLPPSEWKDAPGRKGKEQIFPKSHLTLYSFGGMWVKMEEA
ncbi:cytochrome P450 monooxygenase pc-3 [Trametes versicolor FP-101664 SS1]|uniref:cytochrome P450 monooxygenase pc-3 n=1 Tax=Trametes versicolor (strain FP-101664) TaxID=717944 RepID=UPI00046234AF|nr:cytochrome P450 monooxygenase pc-3 [Trametes versicolor FP-101664 SS1]EIW61465.1 cytochrome P450 monooxygenase pc-3 [Trametes versicolor FP-101664 SS1]